MKFTPYLCIFKILFCYDLKYSKMENVTGDTRHTMPEKSNEKQRETLKLL